MYLRILHEVDDKGYEQYPAYKSSRFNGYYINNNPITVDKREYFLEVDGLPYSFKGHPKNKQWVQFLQDNPHVISNFDTRNAGALEYLFERWQLMKNNG